MRLQRPVLPTSWDVARVKEKGVQGAPVVQGIQQHSGSVGTRVPTQPAQQVKDMVALPQLRLSWRLGLDLIPGRGVSYEAGQPKKKKKKKKKKGGKKKEVPWPRGKLNR